MEQYEDSLTICPFCDYHENKAAQNHLHLAPGTIIQGRYILGLTLGSGGFGVTYIAWDFQLKRKVAIKEYFPSAFSTRALGTAELTIFSGESEENFKKGLKAFSEEAIRLASLHDVSSIVKIYDSFQENHTAYIVMELLHGETLKEYLERKPNIPFEKSVKITISVAQALTVIHERKILHRDISPDNIFLTNDHKVKLIDFGSARYAAAENDVKTMTVIVKEGYSPEEQYHKKSRQGSYTDVYALSAVLYHMLTGNVPPGALERLLAYRKKRKNILVPVSKLNSNVPVNICHAVENALQIRIEDRTQTAEAFIAELTSEKHVKLRKAKIQTVIQYFPLWMKILIPVCFVMTVTAGVFFLTEKFRAETTVLEEILMPDDMARVPFMISSKLETAEQRLAEEKLLYHISGKEYSSMIPANLILKQSIEGGSIVPQNTDLELVVSGGVEDVLVPDVEGILGDTAVSTLEMLGFSCQIQYAYSSVIAEDAVISQSIPSGKECGTDQEMTLTISKGIEPGKEPERKETQIPDFIGKSYQDALKDAQKHQIRILVQERKYSTSVPANTVMAQNPGKTSSAMVGDIVELVVSSGIQDLKMPDCIFLSESEAKEKLALSGLDASVSYETSEIIMKGLVISQNPQPKANISPGDSVHLVISKGSTSFQMPSVIGMTETDARALLAEKKLSVAVNYKHYDGTENQVLAQDIPVDTDVYAGMTVALTISTNQETVKIPDVRNMTEEDAIKILQDAGFTIRNINRITEISARSGTVTDLKPPPDSSQKKGTGIVLTVCKDTVVPEKEIVRNQSESEPETIPVTEKIVQHTASPVKATEKSEIFPSSVVISGISETDTILYVSESRKLNAVVSPANAKNQSVIWSSSDPDVLSVDDNGNIKALSPGKATITVETAANHLRTSFSFSVEMPQLYFHCSAVDLNPTQEFLLNYTASKESEAVSVQIENPDILSCIQDENSLRIHPYRTGSTSITISQQIGETFLISSCYIVVHQSPYAVIEESAIGMKTGEQRSLSYSFGGSHILYHTDYVLNSDLSENYYDFSENVDDHTAHYSSSDPAVVSVDSNGVLTAVGEGSAIITYTINGVSDSCSVAVAEQFPSGTCGSALIWKLENGVLTISGEGALEESPWKNEHKDKINSVIIEKGVTAISSGAFSECSNLQTVQFPDTLAEIHTDAFLNCVNLSSVELPFSIESIEKSAFSGCSNLELIVFYGSQSRIADTADTIPENTTIQGYYGSPAYEYAVTYAREFIPLRRTMF